MSSTWFKDHSAVKIIQLFSAEELKESEIEDVTLDRFNDTVYCPYIQSVIDHISKRMETSDTFSAFSVFDPCHLPSSEGNLCSYGTSSLRNLTTFYG